MLRSAKAMLTVYPFLNADLLLGGVILHDICKIEELEAGELGLASEYSKKGLLLGHIAMGTSYVLSLSQELEIARKSRFHGPTWCSPTTDELTTAPPPPHVRRGRDAAYLTPSTAYVRYAHQLSGVETDLSGSCAP
jgi:hypothetical protein